MEDRDNLPTYPKGWIETQLGNIVNPSDKKVEPSTLQQVPYVGLEHIEKNTGRLFDFGNSSEVTSTKSKFYPGDLLYGKLRPYLNKVHCVNFEGICSTDILVFPKQPYISNEFLSYRFLCKDFVSYASQNVNGVQHPRVNFQSLSEFPIHLPPLNEQRRIVAKIEALKARSQRVKEELEDIPQLLDQFRQSVLAAAFRGDLTADWREQNSNVEPASLFLEQIRNKQKAELQNQGKSSKSKNLKLSFVKIDNLPEIPDTWNWIYFGELITSIRSGSTSVPQNEVSDYPILRSSSVRPGVVDVKDIRFLTKEQSLNEDNFICEGDLLFTRLSGSLDYVGNCAMVKNLNNQRIQYPDRLFCAKLIDTNYSIYSELCFASPLLRNLIKQNAKSSAGHQRISMGAITEAIIPFPPLSEQQEIVRRVTSLFKFADKIAQQYQEIQPQIHQLDQSILAKAFRGELVPQDPNDEPASVLLEHIRAERAKLQTKTAKKSTLRLGSVTTTKTSARRTKKTKPQEESVQLEMGLE